VAEDVSLTGRIRAEARRLGFFKMGAVAAGQLPWRERFEDWLAQGMQGTMTYLERQAPKRKDPSLVLGEVRSVLILAMNYYSDTANGEDPLKGRISRYAWGDDYHSVLADRLQALMNFIVHEDRGARGLFYADTGPVMEKVWGAHSALGWMGKHTNLITREQGSWFFIGVVLLNRELDYDAAAHDRCGTCRRCLQSCPTGAIVAPYKVDARLCISYLTIELRGAIPRELRPAIGNRIFGCDDCQEVCPWNRFAFSSTEQAFRPRTASHMPELTSLVTITEAEFNARFHGSPVRRARRDGFVRNVAIALGNSRAAEAVPALMMAAHDRSPIVRDHAAWALGRIPGPDSEAALLRLQEAEADPSVLAEIKIALDRANAGMATKRNP
jgi:epoxyqueuosine reductase